MFKIAIPLLLLLQEATAFGSVASSGPNPLQIHAANGMVFDALAQGDVEGKPVLLVHGFPRNSLEWTSQLEALAAEGYYAVAPDMRGYSPGARPEEVSEYTVDKLANDILLIADELGWESFHLVGHDWGAILVWFASIMHPDRITSLTALSVPHPSAFDNAIRNDPVQRRSSSYVSYFQQPGMAEEDLLANDGLLLNYFFLDQNGQPLEKAAQYVARMMVPGALTAGLNYYRAFPVPNNLATEPQGEGPASAMDLVGRPDYVRPDIASQEEQDAEAAAAAAEDAASKPAMMVNVPSMLVWGSGDVALARSGVEATASYVAADYKLEILDGVGHWIPEEAPDALNTLLLEHFAKYE